MVHLMASSTRMAALSLPSRGHPVPSPSPSPSPSSLCVRRVMVAVDGQRAVTRRNLTVKAGGVAKFKGTLMREKQLSEMIEQKVSEAKQVCEGDETSDECKVAWDEVEEVSQAKADFRRRLQKQDPLEFFCQDNPETDECRIYED